ncbi:unnamed protein product [Knipowitschia caucasica]
MYILLVTFLFLQNTAIQAARVIGGSVIVVQGDRAVFPCLLTESTESLTQITWQRKTRQIQSNANFFTILPSNGPIFFNGHDERFKFLGNISMGNGSLQLSNVSMSDEGTYTCIFTLFPSGNFKTEIPLNVRVPPKIFLKDNFLVVGNEEVVVASCTAADSWPPATVDWRLGNVSELLRITYDSTDNADGTSTTISTLLGTPTRNLHNRHVQCVIKSPAFPDGRTLPLILQVHFPPSEVTLKEISKTSFECLSEANPKPNYTWSRIDFSWPDSAVEASGAVLEITRPSAQVNGLYLCQATNTYGTQQGHLYLALSSGGTSLAGWILFFILLSVTFVFVAWWYYRSNTKFVVPCLNTQENEPNQQWTAVKTEEQHVPLGASPVSEEQAEV